MIFLREFAAFLFDNSPRSERETTAVLTVALAKCSDLIEMANDLIVLMSAEMQNTLRGEGYDEDRYLMILKFWKEYTQGI